GGAVASQRFGRRGLVPSKHARAGERRTGLASGGSDQSDGATAQDEPLEGDSLRVTDSHRSIPQVRTARLSAIPVLSVVTAPTLDPIRKIGLFRCNAAEAGTVGTRLGRCQGEMTRGAFPFLRGATVTGRSSGALGWLDR